MPSTPSIGSVLPGTFLPKLKKKLLIWKPPKEFCCCMFILYNKADILYTAPTIYYENKQFEANVVWNYWKNILSLTRKISESMYLINL